MQAVTEQDEQPTVPIPLGGCVFVVSLRTFLEGLEPLPNPEERTLPTFHVGYSALSPGPVLNPYVYTLKKWTCEGSREKNPMWLEAASTMKRAIQTYVSQGGGATELAEPEVYTVSMENLVTNLTAAEIGREAGNAAVKNSPNIG